jgi:hypothetical protein
MLLPPAQLEQAVSQGLPADPNASGEVERWLGTLDRPCRKGYGRGCYVLRRGKRVRCVWNNNIFMQ